MSLTDFAICIFLALVLISRNSGIENCKDGRTTQVLLGSVLHTG